NTVEVRVPPVTQPHKEEKTSSTTTTTPPPTVSASTLGSITTQPPRSGVLAFSAASVPRLSGPQGCVRRGFRVTIKSAGVASVTFYLDGHKLKRLTAHSARKGQLSIVIDPSKLRVGAHRLLAKITMVKAPGAARALTASRRMIVLRCASAARIAGRAGGRRVRSDAARHARSLSAGAGLADCARAHLRSPQDLPLGLS